MDKLATGDAEKRFLIGYGLPCPRSRRFLSNKGDRNGLYFVDRWRKMRMKEELRKR